MNCLFNTTILVPQGDVQCEIFVNMFSRRGRSQGLVYKHLWHKLILWSSNKLPFSSPDFTEPSHLKENRWGFQPKNRLYCTVGYSMLTAKWSKCMLWEKAGSIFVDFDILMWVYWDWRTLSYNKMTYRKSTFGGYSAGPGVLQNCYVLLKLNLLFQIIIKYKT